jgi:uncharacterized protein (UPF0276 family)
VQIHLAGHTEKEKYVLDTHAGHVRDEVWELYRRAIEKLGAVSTLIEWDDEIPEWEVLAEEATKARSLRSEVLGKNAPASNAARGAASWQTP